MAAPGEGSTPPGDSTAPISFRASRSSRSALLGITGVCGADSALQGNICCAECTLVASFTIKIHIANTFRKYRAVLSNKIQQREIQ
jgi:hypothetical protein